MSRRTKTFLIALFILAIPLLLVALSPLMSRVTATPDENALVEQTVSARLTDIAQGVPTAAVEARVDATLTAIAQPTATPRAGVEGITDQVGGFLSGSPLLACCLGILVLVGVLYFFSVAKYGQ